jgi:hypothetical protein
MNGIIVRNYGIDIKWHAKYKFLGKLDEQREKFSMKSFGKIYVILSLNIGGESLLMQKANLLFPSTYFQHQKFKTK